MTSVTEEPILPTWPAHWHVSEAQRERIEQLRADHPGTHFQAVLYWPLSCALVIETWDAGPTGATDFTLAPNGRILANVHGEVC